MSARRSLSDRAAAAEAKANELRERIVQASALKASGVPMLAEKARRALEALYTYTGGDQQDEVIEWQAWLFKLTDLRNGAMPKEQP